MAVQVVQSFQTKPNKKFKHLNGGDDLDLYLYPEARYLIVRLPNSRVSKLLARSMFLALFIVTFHWILPSNIPPGLVSAAAESESAQVGTNVVDAINMEILSLFFRDLKNEGIFKAGKNAAFMSSRIDQTIFSLNIINDNKIKIISSQDSNRQNSIPNDTFDFVFVSMFAGNSEFIDRTLKVGGIVALHLSKNPSTWFQKPSNYKIVYFRRFDSTVMAMRKTSHAENGSATQRRLCEYAKEAKKAALNKLEDVLLEPPRAASGKSRRYLKKTRYLPDLMGDSLESYPRRVFIDVGLPENDGGSDSGWFAKNYPTRNKDFEIYKIESVTEESSGKEAAQIGMSEWLKRNVKEEEYVVMKSDAEVVEEMVKSETIRLVDELFLECKPQGKANSSRRAYWECLALYGQLRDEGVAVHQWWG
ncbi:hypothetical protein FEM48_Zijuj06G0153500 [Ziziphus jujuba var. spinosa]|uniref:DUF7870 domain-containing protein n=1 Tax=Ziziphus jujuba var. spinosa TaxID=714518 RepID=A0A978VA25_ZIZJJ|nr:hypothetical protein FEM48_Zijuj06G0153500 [Ziziphus jujuba var. spinosa]